MRRLILNSAALILLMSTLMSLFVFVGRQQPASNAVTMLHLNECALPCWVGITPGKTTLYEARSRIRALYAESSTYILAESPAGFSVSNPSGDVLFYIRFITYEGDVDDATIQITNLLLPSSDVQPSIGELYSLLANPTHISPPTENSAEAVVDFKNAQTEIGLLKDSCDAVALDQKVFTVSAYARTVSYSERNRWRGFGICYSAQR